jgi:tetratricopeptide (TPR) repeat protein/DNA-binding CsgD family transcriptional regulator
MATSEQFDKSASLAAIERRLVMARGGAQKLTIIADALEGPQQLDPHAALGLAAEGYEIAVRERDTAAAAFMLRHRGMLNLALDRPDAAIADLHDAYDLLADLDAAERVHVAIAAGSAHNASGDLRGALSWYRTALDLGVDGPLRADALEALGDLRTSLGDYPRSLEHYLASLAVREELGDLDGAGKALSAIGVVYGLTGDYIAAFDYFTRSLEAFRGSGNRYQEVRALTNLGSIHYSRGELEEALRNALTAMTIYEALGDTPNMGRVSVAIGNIHEKKGELDVALEFQMRAYALLDGTSDDELRVSILLNIGRLHGLMEAHEDALFVFDQALRIARAIDEPRLQYQLHEALAQEHERFGQPARALEHYKRYIRIREELAGQEKLKAIAELQVRFDMEKAEREREIYRLRAIQLESEMRLKQNELAAMALNLVQKKELLDELQSQLKGLRAGRDTVGSAVENILQEIDRSRSADGDWKMFEQQLDNLHQDFIRTLSERYPTLTPTELKICSLARINLLTKDIANLLFTSVRTIHAHKYNIRKKLGLASSTSLTTFLSAI